MARMRRVIVARMEALPELNGIVARHGRAMDTVGAAIEPSPVRRSYGNEEPAMAAAAPEPASRQATAAADKSTPQWARVEAPLDPAPRQATAGAAAGAPHPRPAEAAPAPP